jgi:hypothetical protein
MLGVPVFQRGRTQQRCSILDAGDSVKARNARFKWEGCSILECHRVQDAFKVARLWSAVTRSSPLSFSYALNLGPASQRHCQHPASIHPQRLSQQQPRITYYVLRKKSKDMDFKGRPDSRRTVVAFPDGPPGVMLGGRGPGMRGICRSHKSAAAHVREAQLGETNTHTRRIRVSADEDRRMVLLKHKGPDPYSIILLHPQSARRAGNFTTPADALRRFLKNGRFQKEFRFQCSGQSTETCTLHLDVKLPWL